MKLNFYSETHIGNVRSENQDTIVTDKESGLFIVADGMGGHRGGKTASELAAKVMHEKLKGKSEDTSHSLIREIENAYEMANLEVHNSGLKNVHLRGMGTTLCFLLVQVDGSAYIGNIGDSRVYMFKDNVLWQITEDHTFTVNQKKSNTLSGTQTSEVHFIDDHVLTKSVGFFPVVEPDIFERKVEKGEVYLLCSDGLSGFASHKEIEDILKQYKGEERKNQCIKTALEAGGSDNISVIILEIN